LPDALEAAVWELDAVTTGWDVVEGAVGGLALWLVVEEDVCAEAVCVEPAVVADVAAGPDRVARLPAEGSV
jgi:hypothetical protein